MTFGTILRTAIPAVALAFTMSTVATANTSVKKKVHHTYMSSKLPGYKTEAEAKTACGMGGVVWHATGSKAYHTSKSKYFGKTKHGAYVCEKTAMADKLHAARN